MILAELEQALLDAGATTYSGITLNGVNQNVTLQPNETAVAAEDHLKMRYSVAILHSAHTVETEIANMVLATGVEAAAHRHLVPVKTIP